MAEDADYIRRSADLYSDIIVYPSRIEVKVFAGEYGEERVKKVIARVQLCAMAEQYPVLVIPDAKSRISFFAVKALASEEAMNYAKATAYVIKSFHHQAMADVLFSLYKPSKPIKVFNSEAAALKWLAGFE